jgi:gamma-glutamyltranspeptidase/glutathione hydrolase
MRGTIAAGDRITAEAGARILREGGNAFDAVCAAMLTAPLAEPMLTSLGGGGFLLAHGPGEEATLYDFFVDVPPQRVKKPHFFPIEVDFGTTVQEFHIGAGAIAVPGMVAGIDRIHRERGSLSMERIVAPALEYARNGVRLSALQASFIGLLEPIMGSTPEAAALYLPHGRPAPADLPLRNPDYADFLERFAREGADCFYRGEIADRIERIVRERGGLLRREDLERYRVELRDPIAFGYRGHQVLTNPPPSAGGSLIAFTLEMLERFPNKKAESRKYLITLIEALALTAEFRREHADGLLHEEEALRRLLNDSKRLAPWLQRMQKRLNLWGNTTHISVIDDEGNCASVTSTNGEGSGIVIPGTGIMLNNMLGEEDLNPHGFFRWPAGVRLPSMMAPTLALKDGEPELILGSAGSNRIRSAVVEVLDRHLSFGTPIQKAVDAPRVHFEKGEVFLEPGFDPTIVEEIRTRYRVTEFDGASLFFGGVNAVTGDFDGGADHRRGGAVVRVES